MNQKCFNTLVWFHFRNVKGQSGKEKSEGRRLKEAVELLKLITSRWLSYFVSKLCCVSVFSFCMKCTLPQLDFVLGFSVINLTNCFCIISSVYCHSLLIHISKNTYMPQLWSKTRMFQVVYKRNEVTLFTSLCKILYMIMTLMGLNTGYKELDDTRNR